MIEAATDPFTSLSVALTGGDAEIGDLCTTTTPFLLPIGGGRTTDYFSVAAGRCISGYFRPVTPAPAPPAITGSGQNTAIAISGIGFGLLPPVTAFNNNLSTPVALPGSANLPYISVTDATQG